MTTTGSSPSTKFLFPPITSSFPWKKFRMVEHLELGEIEGIRNIAPRASVSNLFGSLQKFMRARLSDIMKPRNRKDTARLDKVIAVIIARLDHAVDGYFLRDSFATPTMETRVVKTRLPL